MKYAIYILCIAFLCGFLACKKNSPTTSCNSSEAYTSGIKSIIDNNCTGSGCHGTNSYLGDFTSYAGLKTALSNGTFKREVITKKTMPKGSSLSTSEYNKINCWLNNGFPE